MKKPLAELIPQLAKCIAPSTAVATSLIAPLAQAASGDLDPTYGELGRRGPIQELNGPAWSVLALDGGGALLGGGDVDLHCRYYFCYYEVDFEASNFVSELTGNGAIDASYQAAHVGDIEVFDIARQADGKVVAAGRTVDRGGRFVRLAAFRLNSDGTLDESFGDSGIFELPVGDYGSVHWGQSIALEPDGRIAIAGAREIVVEDALVGELLLLRLQADGSVDESFGAAGAYIGPAVDFSADVRLARTAAGNYRVAAATASGCAIVGVTASGAPDGSFGAAGVAVVESAHGDPVTCRSFTSQTGGSLLVAGNAGGHGYAARLLANGARDTAFAPDAAAIDALDDATSVAATADGKVLVAGSGLKGASIMRLQATGELDAQFGDGGRTWIDLFSLSGVSPVVRDLAVRADGSVIAAGQANGPTGIGLPAPQELPFVVWLLGDAGGDSPGVLSVTEPYLTSAEADGHAVVRVRRSGGSAGGVDVAYRTLAGEGTTAGEDFAEASGTLHWADGDATEREIDVSIADNEGPPEGYESVRVLLEDAQGGAGIGTRSAIIDIQPDGAPAGQITLASVQDIVSESGFAEIAVSRDYYSEGEVSVTLTLTGITATAGADFAADPVTLTWGAGEIGWKSVLVDIPDDAEQEDRETFRVDITDPTGGAILGAISNGEIAISASDPPPFQQPRGGGGAAGFLSLLLLGLAELFRSVRRSPDRRA